MSRNIVIGLSLNLDNAAPRFPGGPLVANRPDGIGLALGTQLQSVTNIIIGGKLVQVLADDVDRPEYNVVEGNYVAANSQQGYNIISGENRHLRVEGNEIHRGLQGVHFSGTTLAQPFRLPGRCSLDANRYCNNNASCFIPAVDAASKGQCIVGELVTIDAGVEHGLILRNRILGPFEADVPWSLETPTGAGAPDAVYMGINPVSPVIAENEITGADRAGVRLGSIPFETATVTRNRIHDNGYGIVLQRFPGPYLSRPFGAKITLNHITGSRVQAIGISSLYSFWSLLFDLDKPRGNYWGRSCDDSLGFREFAPADPTSGDSPRPYIIDSYPYGVPVAMTPDEALPSPCTAP